jgi:predicted cobalt transporter CbtA
MEKRLIGRGVLAGGLAGLLAFAFARVFAEPLVQRAIDYESGRDAAQAALDKAAGVAVSGEGHEMFSRTIQADVGIGVGLVLFGVAMGALYAIAYVICIGRTGLVRPRPLALLVAGAGFLTVYLVPFLKYPANPPAIGHEETIRDRGTLYLVMLFASVLLMILAVYVGQRLQGRWGTWRASLMAGAGYVVVIGVVMLLLPQWGHLDANLREYGRHASETPLPLRDPDGAIVYPGFPADLLYQFRVYSLAAQLLMWTTIGLVFAPLAERLLSGSGTTSSSVAPARI